jgi:hypothetical protein
VSKVKKIYYPARFTSTPTQSYTDEELTMIKRFRGGESFFSKPVCIDRGGQGMAIDKEKIYCEACYKKVFGTRTLIQPKGAKNVKDLDLFHEIVFSTAVDFEA